MNSATIHTSLVGCVRNQRNTKKKQLQETETQQDQNKQVNDGNNVDHLADL